MREGKTFEQFYRGLDKRRGEPPAVSPFGVPGVNSDEDAAIILSGMGRGPRVAPVEVTSPKAKTPEDAAVSHTPEKKKRPWPSKAERLERKAAKLRAEIERLKRK